MAEFLDAQGFRTMWENGGMIAATSEADGDKGLVPKPLAGDQLKFLRGDGTWVEISSGTSDYTNLINKPQIEGVILEGDKTFEELNANPLSNIEIESIVALADAT